MPGVGLLLSSSSQASILASHTAFIPHGDVERAWGNELDVRTMSRPIQTLNWGFKLTQSGRFPQQDLSVHQLCSW
jgi:hypothetical protein